ncbi:MAG: glycosyltransferase family 4 protein, partial [Armatimonadetes bacterium]|nr:glycosyltransferase family 4 protein [Armatimonadota bacterium]
MPRVLFLSFTFQPEPGNVKGLPIAKSLAEHGYEVYVLTGFPQYPVGRVYPGYKTRLLFREVMEGVPVCRVPIFPSHDLSALRRALTYCSFAFFSAAYGIWCVPKADVVFYYDNTPTTGSVAWLYRRLRGAKVVMHVADLWPDSVVTSGMVRPKWLRRFVFGAIAFWMRRLYKDASAITVLSPGFGRILRERGVPEGKIDLVHNSVEEDKFFPASPDLALAEELGIDTSKFVVLYAGNFGPMQGLDTVVEAAVELKERDDVQIVMMGTGPEEGRIRALAEELGATNITFVAFDADRKMYRVNALASALLVHLRDQEFLHATIPHKIQAALACGRPLLVGVRGDAADLVERVGGDAHHLDVEVVTTGLVRELLGEHRRLGVLGEHRGDAQLLDGGDQFGQVLRAGLGLRRGARDHGAHDLEVVAGGEVPQRVVVGDRHAVLVRGRGEGLLELGVDLVELGEVRLGVGADDVGGHEVRGELDAIEREIERLGERGDHQRLGEPRHALQQHMPAGEEGHEQLVEHVLLAEDLARQLLADALVRV